MAKAYNKGKKFEYETIKFLRYSGWICNRAYASKGIFDVLAYKDGIKWGIQCKALESNKNRAYLSPKENRELCEYSISPTEEYEFVSWNQKYRCPVMRILKDEFTVIHAYKTFDKDNPIRWRICVKGKWEDLNTSQFIV